MESNEKFGMIELLPSEATRFLSNLCVSYMENLKKNISHRFPDIPLIASLSVFNPMAVPERNSPEFHKYGKERLARLAAHFSSILDGDRLTSEWGHFKFMALELWQEFSEISSQVNVTPTEWLTSSKSYSFMFSNPVTLAEVAQSIPISNSWPERGASAVKCIKTRLRNRLSDQMLNGFLHLSINAPDLQSSPDEALAIIKV